MSLLLESRRLSESEKLVLSDALIEGSQYTKESKLSLVLQQLSKFVHISGVRDSDLIRDENYFNFRSLAVARSSMKQMSATQVGRLVYYASALRLDENTLWERVSKHYERRIAPESKQLANVHEVSGFLCGVARLTPIVQLSLKTERMQSLSQFVLNNFSDWNESDALSVSKYVAAMARVSTELDPNRAGLEDTNGMRVTSPSLLSSRRQLLCNHQVIVRNKHYADLVRGVVSYMELGVSYEHHEDNVKRTSAESLGSCLRVLSQIGVTVRNMGPVVHYFHVHLSSLDTRQLVVLQNTLSGSIRDPMNRFSWIHYRVQTELLRRLESSEVSATPVLSGEVLSDLPVLSNILLSMHRSKSVNPRLLAAVAQITSQKMQTLSVALEDEESHLKAFAASKDVARIARMGCALNVGDSLFWSSMLRAAESVGSLNACVNTAYGALVCGNLSAQIGSRLGRLGVMIQALDESETVRDPNQASSNKTREMPSHDPTWSHDPTSSHDPARNPELELSLDLVWSCLDRALAHISELCPVQTCQTLYCMVVSAATNSRHSTEVRTFWDNIGRLLDRLVKLSRFMSDSNCYALLESHLLLMAISEDRYLSCLSEGNARVELLERLSEKYGSSQERKASMNVGPNLLLPKGSKVSLQPFEESGSSVSILGSSISVWTINGSENRIVVFVPKSQFSQSARFSHKKSSGGGSTESRPSSSVGGKFLTRLTAFLIQTVQRHNLQDCRVLLVPLKLLSEPHGKAKLDAALSNFSV